MVVVVVAICNLEGGRVEEGERNTSTRLWFVLEISVCLGLDGVTPNPEETELPGVEHRSHTVGSATRRRGQVSRCAVERRDQCHNVCCKMWRSIQHNVLITESGYQCSRVVDSACQATTSIASWWMNGREIPSVVECGGF